MANNKNNIKKDNSKLIKGAVAVAVGVVMLVGAFFGGVAWGKSLKATPKDDGITGKGEVIVSPGANTGKYMSLMTTPLAETETPAQTEGAYTITATVDPEYATNVALDWSVEWDQTATDSMGENYYEIDWYQPATGGDWQYTEELTVTDFVDITPASDGAHSATLVCKQPFSCPVTVVCSARDGGGAQATCRVDYQHYITKFEFNGATKAGNYKHQEFVLKEKGTTVTSKYTISWSYGTVMPDYTVTISTPVCGTDFGAENSEFNNAYDLRYGAAYQSDNAIDPVELTLKNTSSKEIFSVNTEYKSFLDTYVIQQPAGITENQKQVNRAMAVNLMKAIITKKSGINMFTFTAKVTTENQTLSSMLMLGFEDIASFDGIPDLNVNVSGITLNTNNYIFKHKFN